MAASSKADDTASGATAPPSYNRVLVLVVDDSPADRLLISQAFKKAGDRIDLHLCSAGQDALDYLQARPPYQDARRPSACLLDLKMPGVSGLDVLSEIKSDDRLRALPVMMFSTSNRRSDVRASYERFASGYIRKPMDVDEMDDIARTLTHLWTDLLEIPAGENEHPH
ncbi:MAG: response regulator [Pseudomonadota bacterium]